MKTALVAAAMMIGAALAVGGCVENGSAANGAASTPALASSSSGGAAAHAQCLVCKYENDLACVDLDVDKDTPRATVDGKEYYFCSQSCKKQFLKDPAKYTAQK
ncbi:MAG TPA: YHS domain-containing protein [Tepidisphaeraceae bacterium]|jgi:YHS domain-containing protein